MYPSQACAQALLYTTIAALWQSQTMGKKFQKWSNVTVVYIKCLSLHSLRNTDFFFIIKRCVVLSFCLDFDYIKHLQFLSDSIGSQL